MIDFKAELESQEMLQYVKQELTRLLGKVPANGWVAGGAISNIIISKFYGGTPVINDIDIFICQEYRESKESTISRLGLDVNGNHLQQEVEDEYQRTNVSGYRVTGVARNGLINAVLIDRSRTCMDLISDFDINCIQSGYDPFEDKIYFTTHFVDFLRTRQMRIVQFHSPFSTALRILKKKDELDVYCDVDREMNFISKGVALCGNSGFTVRVKQETLEKYMKYMPEFSKYFVITKDMTAAGGAQNLGYGEYNHSNTLANFMRSEYLYTLYPLNLQGIEDFEKMPRMREGKTFSRILNLLYGFGVNKYKRDLTMKMLSTRRIADFILNNLDYDFLDCRIQISRLSSLDDYFYSHSNMLRDATEFHMNYEDLLALMDFMKAMEKEYGSLGIGIIENEHKMMRQIMQSIKGSNCPVVKFSSWEPFDGNDSHEIYEPLPDNGLVNLQDKINKLVEDYKRKLQEGLKAPIAIDPTVNEYYNDLQCVRELTSRLALKMEGDTMHHCVGGYSHAVSEGRSLIFTVETEGGVKLSDNKSTIEIYTPRSTGKHFQIAQHRSVHNCTPTEKHLTIGNKIKNYLNNYCMLDFIDYIKDPELKENVLKEYAERNMTVSAA